MRADYHGRWVPVLDGRGYHHEVATRMLPDKETAAKYCLKECNVISHRQPFMARPVHCQVERRRPDI